MKYEDEITVMVYDGCEELIDKIISRGFKKIDDYMLYDMYMVYKDVIVNGSENDKEILKILSKCVLIRSIDDNKHYDTKIRFVTNRSYRIVEEECEECED